MAIPTPDHLFAQAEGLLTLYPGSKPRQTENRWAISAAYYGVFHVMLAQAADIDVSARYRSDARYTLANRSVFHAWLRSLCHRITELIVPAQLRPFLPAHRVGVDLSKVALAVQTSQDQRHSADYDPAVRLAGRESRTAVGSAREAVTRFRLIDVPQLQIFLALLLFPPRGKG